MELFEGAVEWLRGLEPLRIDLLGRLLLAAVLGGAIGWDREASGKPAGLRTNILICVGAALLTEISITVAQFGIGQGAGTVGDPSRIAAQIVSGIGFLGAGTIIQARGSVSGLTTAATLWVVAAIGIAVGAHAYVEAVGATVLVLLTLAPLQWMEDRIKAFRSSRTVHFVAADEPGLIDRIEEVLDAAGLVARCESVTRNPRRETISTVYEVRGQEGAFDRARSELVEEQQIREILIES